MLRYVLKAPFVSWFTAFARSFRPKPQRQNIIIDGTVEKPFAERDFIPLNQHRTIKTPSAERDFVPLSLIEQVVLASCFITVYETHHNSNAIFYFIIVIRAQICVKEIDNFSHLKKKNSRVIDVSFADFLRHVLKAPFVSWFPLTSHKYLHGLHFIKSSHIYLFPKLVWALSWMCLGGRHFE